MLVYNYTYTGVYVCACSWQIKFKLLCRVELSFGSALRPVSGDFGRLMNGAQQVASDVSSVKHAVGSQQSLKCFLCAYLQKQNKKYYNNSEK